jgi:hypothetical protein
MNITAVQIQKSCSGTQLIEQEIRSILKTFQSEIVEAGKNGSTSVIVEVPTNFNITGMSNRTAQTIIYNRLIENVEENGFNVRVSMTESGVTYCIRWDIQKNDSDLADMRNVIASHMARTKRSAERSVKK